MQQALESALAELVLGAVPQGDAAVAAWLERHGVSPEDAEAIRVDGIERLLVYRSLVRGTLEEAIAACIPRTLARLGPLFASYFDRFLAERGPTTHYVRDTAVEFLDFCEPLWSRDARVPRYLTDLARHEALHIQIGAAPPRSVRAESAPLDLDAGLAFVEAARLVEYEYAVHELPDDPSDRTEPVQRASALFVYRSPEHEVRYLALSPEAASLLRGLMGGASLRTSLVGAAREHAVNLDETLLSGAARLLADLSERGAVLGPCRPTRAEEPGPNASCSSKAPE